MATSQFTVWHKAALALVTALCVQGAFAQDKAAPAPAPAAEPAPAAAPAPAPAAAPAPADAAAAPAAEAPKKRRVVRRRSGAGCIKLDDPWDNLCAIQKKAAIACADLPAGKRKGKHAAPVVGNPRKECVDNYMRNV